MGIAQGRCVRHSYPMVRVGSSGGPTSRRDVYAVSPQTGPAPQSGDSKAAAARRRQARGSRGWRVPRRGGGAACRDVRGGSTGVPAGPGRL
eukprot:4407251-Pleurochrysis_carterae.AAC.1